MLLRFAVSIAGADFAYQPKQIANIDDEWARSLIASGIAEKVGEPDGQQDLHATGNGAGDTSGGQGVPSPRRKRS